MKGAATVDSKAVQRLLDRARRDVESGGVPSCQLAIAQAGELVAFVTLGSATNDTRYALFSVTKALTASAVWLLLGDGRLSTETRVADVIPEFGANGKQDVTVAHLLLHTAGFPRAPMSPEQGGDPHQRVARMANWRLDWAPGTRTEYHATSAQWVLAELIERSSGADYRTLVNVGVAGALGLKGLALGVPVGAQGDICEIVAVGEEPVAVEKRLGAGVKETGLHFLLRFNEPFVREVGVPGAGAVGSAADVALLYQAFLHNQEELWSPDVLADATANIRNRLVDPLISVSANRTLGLVVAGDDDMAIVRLFGKSVSPRAFGAAGVGGQMAWADPDTGLSFCYLTNGLDVDQSVSFLRSAGVATQAGRCLRVEGEE